jgi:hypothetical protein
LPHMVTCTLIAQAMPEILFQAVFSFQEDNY